MVPEAAITVTAWEAVRLTASDVPGVLVECGVWRGRASMAMLLAQRQRFGRVLRPVFMLDSFEGLPQVSDQDGPLARQTQATDPKSEEIVEAADRFVAMLSEEQRNAVLYNFKDVEQRVR